MSHFPELDATNVTGAVAENYIRYLVRHPDRIVPPPILRAMGYSPALQHHMAEIAEAVVYTEGYLSLEHKEMLAVVVSVQNRCDYCTGAHTYFLVKAHMSPRKLNALLNAPSSSSSPLEEHFSAAECALLTFARQFTSESGRTTPEKILKLELIGWSRPQIAEAIYLCSLYAFYNQLANGFGLPDPGYFEQAGVARPAASLQPE